MLVKIYGADATGEKPYSPAECISAVKRRIEGDPDPRHVSTSFTERQNLTLRMSSQRFTRLTNAFSKKIENHALSVALHYMNYNFCRIHKTLWVVNDDGDLVHHAFIDSPIFSFDSGDQQPGSKTDVTLPVAGDFDVLCAIHPKMKLVVHVQ
jgi:hypothetical protein